MDFLDPVKRRRHRRRLIVGYVLVGVLIALIGRFFVIWASGESINPRTGKIVDYGLLFVDSKPGGADIFLNNQARGSTSARFNLPAGNYDLKLTRSGYYDWHNKLNVAGQSVDRAVYPLLFPKAPKPQNLKIYSGLPSVLSTSPDRHWLLIEQNPAPGSFSFDLYDTSKPTQAATSLAVPATLLENTDRAGQALSIIRWSSDNNHFLLKHAYDGGAEFIVMSRSDPVTDLNLNKRFNLTASSADFNSGKFDQVYLYTPSDRSLNLANTSRGTVSVAVTKVSDWKAIDNNLVLYFTTDAAPAGQVSYKISDNGKSYTLANLPDSPQQQFDAKQYQSNWYYSLGNDAYGRVVIYKNPLDALRAGSKASPLVSLVSTGNSKLSYSENDRFIASQSGQQFNIYDVETQTRYRYSVTLNSSPELDWMDGYRLVGAIDNQAFVMDFDSQNQHKLLPAASAHLAFDGPYNHMYSFSVAAADGTTNLQITDLRAGADLPKP